MCIRDRVLPTGSLALMLLLGTLSGCVSMSPYRLRVEYIQAPRGVDKPSPRFSWALSDDDPLSIQQAYRIVVSTDSALTWDSGRVESNISMNVKYAGSPLAPNADYAVQITAFGDHGFGSANTTFSTGLYTKQDWAGAEWIGAASTETSFLLRAEASFTSNVKRAVAYVVGLGYYKLYVNGQKASTHELGPFTTFSARVYYDTYDITDYMRSDSAHAFGVVLGNGWYSQPSVNVGMPSLLCRIAITLEDGSSHSVVSGAGWQSSPGPVQANDIYDGETYDARLEQPGWTSFGFAPRSAWAAAKSVAPPSEIVKISSHAPIPPIRIAQTYSPIAMYESSPGGYVFDFGQNMAGFTTLHIPEGVCSFPSNISQLHAEAVHGPPPAGVYHHYGNTKEVNTFLSRGDGAAVRYTAQFVYAGFRYVQLTGYPGVPEFSTLEAHFVHTCLLYTSPSPRDS
eukprot:TRINITY_DN4103_c0_g1_i5.p1 TRINITY_DN4103_c0_g1~~TRINITY_DN4103_c0_g1_i5.p1  ORF type:complete len:454 (+),score=88.83 TRINITY_DN4103_c0_g1_i5:167-1528(+)